MLAFIIPLKSRKVSKSWNQVVKLLEATLRSVCNQTSDSYIVVVVCHEIPSIDFFHPNIKFIQVEFPPPNLQKKIDKTIDDREICSDKSKKLWIGLNYISKYQPEHVMFVDADDYVSKHLVEFVAKNSKIDCWKVCKGYEYQFGSNLVYHRNKNFNKRCGSSHIIRYSLVDFREKKIEDINWDFLRHQTIEDTVGSTAASFECLPFNGAIYLTESTENIRSQLKYYLERNKGNLSALILFYLKRLYKFVVSRPLDNKIRDEFGILD